LSASEASLLRFGVIELDLKTGELRKAGVLLHLPPQPFKILALLASRPGQLVTREEIQQEIWGSETFVDFELGLNAAIKTIRDVLGDDPETPRYIQTLPRRGYRFIAPVDVAPPSPAASVAAMSSLPGAGGDTGATAPAVEAVRHPPLEKRWVLVLTAGGLVAMAAVVLALNVAGLRDRLLGKPAPPRIESIAVLPLENLSHDPEQEYFADGMTEELITNLGKISALRVISRTSVMHYKRTKKTLPDIARELNVDALVEGTVQREGNRVRITANLLHAPTDRHLWAESYERDLRDVLALQSELAQTIAREIEIKVTPEEHERLARTRPVDPEAHEFYLKGLYFWDRRSGGGLDKAIKFFQQAIEKDPGYCLAYAGLADAYSSQVAWDVLPPKEGSARGRAAAEKALQDDKLAEAHVSLAFVMTYDRDLLGAEKEFRRGIQLNPGYARGHLFFAIALAKMGRVDAALAEVNRAHDLDPLSLITTAVSGWILYVARRYDQAVKREQQALGMDPNFAGAHSYLGVAYEQELKYTLAIEEFQKAVTLSGGSPSSVGALGHAYAASGNKAEALRVLRRLREQSNIVYVSSFSRAMVYTGLGEKELAFTWLQSAFEERDPGLMNLMVDPQLDPLRSDPRFQDLLRRMNFPPQVQ
jgi:TolB-like protein/DNA-binding winged helix-turn-helix (wHTH) protein/Tfp pilus assembly protein PilF